MTYQVIPRRKLIRHFKQVMEQIINKSASISFSYKGEELKSSRRKKKSLKNTEKQDSSKVSQLTQPHTKKSKKFTPGDMNKPILVDANALFYIVKNKSNVKASILGFRGLQIFSISPSFYFW